MSILELIKLASNRLTSLNNDYSNAFIAGKIDDMQRIELLIIETESTLDKLKTL